MSRDCNTCGGHWSHCDCARPNLTPAERDAGLIERVETWLRACSKWLLTNDLDMTCPMEADPLDLADALAALSAKPTIEEQS